MESCEKGLVVEFMVSRMGLFELLTCACALYRLPLLPVMLLVMLPRLLLTEMLTEAVPAFEESRFPENPAVV